MDPLADLQADIPVMSPVDRYRLHGDEADAREQRDAEKRKAERQAEAETAMMARQAQDRAQLMTRGYTDAELAVHNAEAEASRAGRIEQLEAELDRIDPRRRQAKAQRARDAADAVTLARARAIASDPFMRRVVRDFDGRRRPSVSRSGVARRSETCQHCVDNNVDDETSYLLHSDPELNVPVTPPGSAAQAGQAERRSRRVLTGTGWPQGVISR